MPCPVFIVTIDKSRILTFSDVYDSHGTAVERLRLLGYYAMSTGKGLQTLRTFVVPSLARSGRLRRVVLLGPLESEF